MISYRYFVQSITSPKTDVLTRGCMFSPNMISFGVQNNLTRFPLSRGLRRGKNWITDASPSWSASREATGILSLDLSSKKRVPLCERGAFVSTESVSDVDSCLNRDTIREEMSLTNPHQVVNIPWRNNNFSLTNKETPLSDQSETIIGVYLLVLGWLSWFGNSVVIFVLYKQRAALQPTDYLTFNLAISDASISVFGYSRGILEIFNVFRDNGYIISSVWTCQVDGFCTLLFGLVSINTLTVISVTRYIKGCHPHKAHCITNSTISICVTFIWAAALFWSGAPLVGWGSFTDRGYGTCEVDWAKANYSTIHKSYIVLILIFCFFMPVLIMFFSYVSIINTVKRGNAMSAEGDLTDRQRKMERDVTIVSIVICTAFIVAWSPYAVVSMWSAWGYQVPGLTSIFTRLFAKSASFYNPLIYFGLSSKFRKDIGVLLPCTREGKDTVKLKRFKPKAEAPSPSPATPAPPTPPGSKLPQQKYREDAPAKPSPSPDSGVGSPPGTSPPAKKEIFIPPVPLPSEEPEYESDRL